MRKSPPGGVAAFRVQSTVQAWCDGEANHGWALLRSSGTSESDAGRCKTNVELVVHYVPPPGI